MSVVDSALPRIKVNEGYLEKPERGPGGHLNVGYGCNLDAGMSEYAASALCAAQIQERALALSAYWWAKGLDDVRFGVIVEVSFNIGLTGLLHFVDMLGCVGKRDWIGAQAALLDSDAARELPGRYQRLGQILLTGVP